MEVAYLCVLEMEEGDFRDREDAIRGAALENILQLKYIKDK